MAFFGSLYDRHDHFHVLNVESADCIVSSLCAFQHFLGCNQWHNVEPLFCKFEKTQGDFQHQ